MRSLSILGAAVSAALLASCTGGHGAAVPAAPGALQGGAPQGAARHVKGSAPGHGGLACQYGLLVTGSKANVHIDAATIAGDLGVVASKANVHLKSTTVKGAGRFQSDANVHAEGSASFGGGQLVDASGLAAAVNAVTSASSTDAAMPPNTAGPASIALAQGQSLTLNGTHSTNVIDVASIAMAGGSTLTLNAPQGSSFVVNVAGAADFQTVALSGGITAGDVVFNFTGAQGDVHVESGASVAGTLLALARGVQFDDGAVVGGSVVADGGNLHMGSPTIQAACPSPATLGCTITEYGDGMNANAYPVDIATGSDGALWFAEYGNNAVGRITTAGTITESSIGPQSPIYNGDMEGLAAGPDGALWFTQMNNNKIGRITTAGVVTLYPTGADPNGLTGQSRIVAGPDGAMWFTDTAANSIGRITMAGTITEFPVPTVSAGVHGIAAGPDGALWFTEQSNLASKIGRITTAGAITEYQIPTYNAGPNALAAGSDGAMWFAEINGDNANNNGAIGRIDMSGKITEYPISVRAMPEEITSGPDGALYFTEIAGGAIGRITTGGAITHCPIPTPNANPFGITTGPDGAIWFTEDLGQKIGRLH